MNQEIINKAQNIISQKKRDALAEFNAKMKPFYEKEKFVELEKQHTRLVLENAKKQAYGQKVDRTEELSLKSKIDQMTNGIAPNFSCKNCCDEGFVNGAMCICLKKEISQILMRESGFEKLENFEDAQKTCGDLAPVYSLMKKWCNSNFKKNLVYLAGPTGVGKTYLIRCMANELIERGKVVKIVTAFALNQDFKNFARTNDDSILNSYTSGEVLFIDDLGTEPIYRNITQEFLYLVINERKMKGLPTILTSNLSMEDVRDRYDERIFSRIADRDTSITLFIDGQDKRIKK